MKNLFIIITYKCGFSNIYFMKINNKRNYNQPSPGSWEKVARLRAG